MKKQIIAVEHKGQDYYGIHFNGKYGEVSLSEGEIIKNALKIIKEIVENGTGWNTFRKNE